MVASCSSQHKLPAMPLVGHAHAGLMATCRPGADAGDVQVWAGTAPEWPCHAHAASRALATPEHRLRWCTRRHRPCSRYPPSVRRLRHELHNARSQTLLIYCFLTFVVAAACSQLTCAWLSVHAFFCTTLLGVPHPLRAASTHRVDI